MSDEPGHEPGHPPVGYGWGDLIATFVEQHGTLTAVAWKLIEHGDDVASIERALRRLRNRGQLDGGVWGQRLLRVFGVPKSIEARLRWMGLYHSPFNDLPVALCMDQLRLWDRPPISESRARVWIQLGHASCALRQQRFAIAKTHVDAARAASPDDSARIEILLVDAYLASRDGRAVEPLLDEAAALLPKAALDDRACFEARLVDQRAYQLNKAGDHAGALALYDALATDDVHPFASYRRDAGRAWGLHRAGNADEAVRLARRACDHAGDGGYTRLRAMGFILLFKMLGAEAAGELARAHAIALRMGDGELLARIERVRSGGA